MKLIVDTLYSPSIRVFSQRPAMFYDNKTITLLIRNKTAALEISRYNLIPVNNKYGVENNFRYKLQNIFR